MILFFVLKAQKVSETLQKCIKQQSRIWLTGQLSDSVFALQWPALTQITVPQHLDRRCAPQKCWGLQPCRGILQGFPGESQAASVRMLLALQPGLLIAMGRRKVRLSSGVANRPSLLMGTPLHKAAACLPQGKRTLARDFPGKGGEPARYQEKRQRASNGVWHEPKLDNASFEEYYKTQVLVIVFPEAQIKPAGRTSS